MGFLFKHKKRGVRTRFLRLPILRGFVHGALDMAIWRRVFCGVNPTLFHQFFRKNSTLGVLGLLLTLCPPTLQAQQPQFSNLRTRTLDAWLPVQVLDSLTIAAPLLSVTDSASGQMLDAAIFSLENNRLRTDTARLRQSAPAAGRLIVAYRVLPADLGAPLRRLDTTAIRQAMTDNAIEFDYTPYTPQTKPWETSGLVSNGAYTRGLSFGNNQNLAFNSNLNLQLNGRLGNDLELTAALSDNTVPLQPDGTTRQLQEFDRIFIQLKRKNASLIAGDFDLVKPNGYFSNYFKRVQGAMVQSEFSHAKLKTQNTKLRAAASISRGKFNRQIIAGQEGNQGPYRLQGTAGERFIIVLAGTEKVFLDGMLLRRGLDDDYVMDYNLGELTFTPKRLISKDSRIIVEFEYAVQAFLRSTVATEIEHQREKNRFYLHAYSEQDSRNAGGAQDLTPAQRERLAQVGDDLRSAFASGIDTLAADAALDPGRVLYQAVDTLACGVPVSVLLYSTDLEKARFAARFTEVPQGQGNYVQVQSGANGRVFRWVAPDPATCQPTGNFEPVVRLIAPEGRQLFAAGTEWNPSKNSAVRAELALSNRDLNRYSPLGNTDNAGLSGFFSLRQNLLPAAVMAKGWDVQANATYEYAGKQFAPLNPYRPAEFVRDWNIGATDSTATEHWARGGLTAQRKDWGNARYEFGAFVREGRYDGARHFMQARLQRGGFDVLAEANLLNTDGPAENTRFSRPKFDVGKTFFLPDKKPLFKIGVYGERERNERRSENADTLNKASFWYDLGKIYWQTADEKRTWKWGASWMRRNDFVPTGSEFSQNTSVDEANANGTWAAPPAEKNTQSLTWNISWRRLRVLDSELTTLAPQETYLGRVDYSISAWKNALTFTTGYEISSGQTPRIEYNYLRVNPGEGQYTWIDRNRDSILTVDEMEIAVFQDQANYVRVAVTTPNYVRTNNTGLNQSLRLDPRVLWVQSKKRWQQTLSRFSTQSNLQINRRVLASAREEPAWNPFDLAVADTALVAVSAVTRHVLYFNRANPAWDASLAWADNRNRSALTTGAESRRLADWTAHGRVNFSQTWSAELDLIRGLRENDSEQFDARDYAIRYWKAVPKLTWLPTRAFRLVAAYTWQDGRNTLLSAETALQNDWSAELTWNPPGKPNSSGFRAGTSLRARANYVNVNYSGIPNSAVAYAMLDGLQNGKNFLWNLNLDRQLSRSVQLSLNYEGRKTGENRIVHVGRAQVRAVF